MFFVRTDHNRVVQGDERILDFQLRDTNDEPIDLDGKNVYITIQRYRDSGPILIDNEVCDHVDSSQGRVSIRILESETEAWEQGHYYGRLTITDASEGTKEQSDIFDFQVLRSF